MLRHLETKEDAAVVRQHKPLQCFVSAWQNENNGDVKEKQYVLLLLDFIVTMQPTVTKHSTPAAIERALVHTRFPSTEVALEKFPVRGETFT